MKWYMFIVLILAVPVYAGNPGCSNDTPDCTGSHDVCHLDHCSFGACIQDRSAPDGWKLCIQGGVGSYCCNGNLNVVMTNSDCTNAQPCVGGPTIPLPNTCTGVCEDGRTGLTCSNWGMGSVAGVCSWAGFLCCGGSSLPPPSSPPPVTPPPVVPPPPPVVPPPPTGPLCGPGMICGAVKDQETGTVSLRGIVIILRTIKGAYLTSARTDADGLYSFTGLGTAKYIVSVSLNASWAATPTFAVRSANDVWASFFIHNVPAKVKVKGARSEFVLLSHGDITSASPPDVVGVSPYISRVIGANGSIDIEVPAGNWSLACWMGKNRTNSVSVGDIKAQNEVEVSCPQSN